MSVVIKQRSYAIEDHWDNTPPLMSRILSARGLRHEEEATLALKNLHHFASLQEIDLAVERLVLARERQESVWIIGDYDVDGATSTSLVMRCLKAWGYLNCHYFVPNRFEFGYGLSPKIIQHLSSQKPQLLMTVDNGIVSFDGVVSANAMGMDVIVTDHHLASEQRPEAHAVVNPNQPGNTFPSQCLAGVGVAFYVMAALKSRLSEQGCPLAKQFSMQTVLDLVAIGTIADLVPLDANNRILVRHGLLRIKQGLAWPGIRALIRTSQKNEQTLSSSDIAFAIAPRLNAAGRLEDMSTGVACLLSDSESDATHKSLLLNDLNEDRRLLEKQMKQEAIALAKTYTHAFSGLCLFQPDWHEGLIGLVASKLKDSLNRPVIVFTESEQGALKGSGRSIPVLHLQKTLAQIDQDHPGLIQKFGGHAMAAGLTIPRESLESFSSLFDQYCSHRLEGKDLSPVLMTDGVLSAADFSLASVDQIEAYGPWGQGFEEPVFSGDFFVLDQHLVGHAHLKLHLAPSQGGSPIDAISFFVDINTWPNHSVKRVRVVFQLADNRYRGRRKLQLIIRHIETLET